MMREPWQPPVVKEVAFVDDARVGASNNVTG